MSISVSIRFAALLLPVTLFAACTKAPEATPETATPVAVTTAPAAEADWPAHFDAGGVLRARTTATIASRLLAPVTAVRVRPGDQVRQGQVLIELDAASLTANASRASAAVAAATEGIAAAVADIEGAEAGLVLAKATQGRIATLKASRAATAQELDEANAALAAAESRLKATKARHAEATAGLEAQTAAKSAATTDASYRALTAPFDGIVIERRIDPESMATPGMPLLVVESPSALQLEVRLDAARAALIRVGQTVPVDVDTDGPSVAARGGRVSEISTIEAGTHSFALKIDIADARGWRSGLYGRAHFSGAPRKTLQVPAPAIIRRGQLSFVFVASTDGHARLRAVSLGETHPSQADMIEVLDGLTAGELILLTPPAALVDGARITVTGARK